MFNQEQLQALLSFEGGDHQVVSLYLDTDLTRESIDGVRLQARGFMKEIGPDFRDDAEAVERYLNSEYDWTTPGLALFSCAPLSFFVAHPVNVAFRNRVRLGARPYVKPLTHFLDYYAHYGVILIDRVGARFFEYDLGELLSSDGFMGEEVRKLKRGGGSSATGMRGGQGNNQREEAIVQRNLRQAAAAAARFFDNKEIRRLFLGGTSETASQFQDQLSRRLQSCLAGTFAIDMGSGEHEVRARALELLQEANARREEQLVDRLITFATSKREGNAVLGLADTLKALGEGRVQTLVLSDGYRVPGYVGQSTGFLFAFNGHAPEAASEELVAVEDIVESAIKLTLSQGGHVEVIAGNPELEAAGRIGAILRF